MIDKDRIAKYALSKKVFETISLVLAGSYLENLLDKEFGRFFGGWPFFPDSEGYLTTRAPRWGSHDEVPWVAIQSDFGDVVHGILLDPEKWNGKSVPVVSEIATPDKTTAIFQQGMLPLVYREIPSLPILLRSSHFPDMNG